MKSHGQCCALWLKPQGQKSSLLRSFLILWLNWALSRFFPSGLALRDTLPTSQWHRGISLLHCGLVQLQVSPVSVHLTGVIPSATRVSDMSTGRFAALHSSGGLISAHPVHGTNAILTSCRPRCLGEVVVDTMLGVIKLTLSQCSGKSTFFACLFGIKSTLFGVLYSSQLA